MPTQHVSPARPNYTDAVTLTRSNEIARTVRLNKGNAPFGGPPKEKRWKDYELRINPEEPVFPKVSEWHSGMQMDVLEFNLERRVGSVPVEINERGLKVDTKMLLLSDLDQTSLQHTALTQAKSITVTITTKCPTGEYEPTGRLAFPRILALIEIMRKSGHQRESTTVILEIHSRAPDGSSSLDCSRLVKCARALLKPFALLSEPVILHSAIGYHSHAGGKSMHNLSFDADWLNWTPSIGRTVLSYKPQEVPVAAYQLCLKISMALESVQLRYGLDSRSEQSVLEVGGLALQEIGRVFFQTFFPF